MPVLVERGTSARNGASTDCIEIGLLNNMPDAALEATERQLVGLLTPAARDVTVRLRLFSLPGIPHGERGRLHLEQSYLGIDDLWDSGLDALIVTGTEPRAAALRDEPYWPALTEVLDWAEDNTVSTVWSCLAAHAAVLYSDGVERHPLADKCIGVFDCSLVSDHPLTRGLASTFAIPHSRHNELRANELAACGYEILTHSAQAGVDTFVKQGKSLFVFFQGHPEYDAASLLGEYRRDLGRFLRRERDVYPVMPQGYFDDATAALLTAFRARALAERCEEMVSWFPVAEVERALTNPWRPAAARIYQNWLAFIAEHKARRQVPAVAIARKSQPSRAAPVLGARLEAYPALVAGGSSRSPFIERRRGDAAADALWRGRDRRASAAR